MASKAITFRIERTRRGKYVVVNSLGECISKQVSFLDAMLLARAAAAVEEAR